uniref:Integrase catalytic domain-containing protein n=1 Tax=Clytia hemisphaerica TaxID=252671 RepID=A0A7M5XEQ1_9CNID
NIAEYINQFEQLNHKLKTYKIELPSPVLAYQLLKNANLPKSKRDLARATIAELKYDDMKRQIKAIYDSCTTDDKTTEDTSDILVENEQAYYSRNNYYANRGRNFRGSRYRGRGGANYRGSRQEDSRAPQAQPSTRYRNCPDENGNPTRCKICGSIYHYYRDCPDADKKDLSLQHLKIQLFTQESGVELCFLEQMVSETLSCAVIDPGCPSNVCGKNWLNCYLDSLPNREDVTETKSKKSYQFGPSQVYQSLKKVNIPINIGGKPGHILTDVVDCEVPLLLSKHSIKEAGGQLDFVKDTITLFGTEIKLQHTSSGHYCIPISPKQILVNRNIAPEAPIELYLTINDLNTKSKEEKKSIAVKLHKQFGHPVDSTKLKTIVKDAEIKDDELLRLIDQVTEECDICTRYRKARARPVVSLSLSKEFNGCLAMDLKFITINDKKYIVFHMIDLFTRYSAASVIKSKHKEVIVDEILKHWVAIFGSPQSIFADNGGEFNNELLRDVAELLDVSIASTAAESPWSNGVVERHNATLGNMIHKIVADTQCSIQNALVWAVSAKNALSNNLGYSPNQLVFGRNPNLPSTLTSQLPALRTKTSSELVAEHLNALHSARRAFIQAESSKRIKTALSRQTRTTTSKEFNNGDTVYYKRNSDKDWHGPGTIIGIDGKVVVVRHGGNVLRVSPCHLTKANKEKSGSSPKEILIVPDEDEQPHVPIPELFDIDIVSNETVMIPVENPIAEPKLPKPDKKISEIQTVETTQPVGDKKKTDRRNKSNSQQIRLPRIGQQILFIDPDTNKEEKFIAVNRAGKANGKNKHWFNVKNLVSGVIKCVDFENIEWQPVEGEVLYSSSNNPQVLAAKQKELEKWIEYNVYEEVDNEGQETVSTRWVITEKSDKDTNTVKARLVARGFEEITTEIRTDSPTICKENLRLVSTIAVSNSWKIHSMDIKAAFLQGCPINREVFIQPPREANTSKLWKLKRTVYGLNDAPRSWYLKAAEELVKAGATRSKYDQALFFWRNKGKLQGVLCCHVDDFFYAGTRLFHEKIVSHVQKSFDLSKESFSTFQYLGLDINQTGEFVAMHQNDYIKTLQPIELKDTSKRNLTQEEKLQLKALIGQIQWVSKQTRPDLAFASCDLSNRVKDGTTDDIRLANKYLRKLQNSTAQIHLPNIGDVTKSTLYAYSDASHANLPGFKSQGGFIILIKGENGHSAPIVWTSKKVKRVVKSPLAAETLALQEAVEHAALIKALLCEIYDSEQSTFPTVCITDSKSLRDTVHTSTVVEDKGLMIDLCCLREMIQGKLITIEWVPASKQLADCLTKSTASAALLMKVLAGEAGLPSQ